MVLSRPNIIIIVAVIASLVGTLSIPVYPLSVSQRGLLAVMNGRNVTCLKLAVEIVLLGKTANIYSSRRRAGKKTVTAWTAITALPTGYPKWEQLLPYNDPKRDFILQGILEGFHIVRDK